MEVFDDNCLLRSSSRCLTEWTYLSRSLMPRGGCFHIGCESAWRGCMGAISGPLCCCLSCRSGEVPPGP
eukprot:6533097-Prorocentrum_lima.AAC.1